MPSQTTPRGFWRRIPWGLRMTFWLALLVAIVAAGLVYFLRGDGGERSRSSFVHTFETEDYHSLAFSPTQDGVVLFGHHGGVQMSEDDGQNWSEVVEQSGWDAMNLAYDPSSPETVYAAGHNIFYRSGDSGRTWSAVDADLPGLDLHAFASSSNGRVYAFAVGHGLYVSEGDPASWRLLSSGVPQATTSILELSDGTLLLPATDEGILRSQDGGRTWSESTTGIDTAVIFTVKGDPQGGRLYAGTSEGVFVSTDGAKNWSATALNDTAAYVIGVNPSDPQELMVINSDGELFHSRDGAASWG